MENNISVAGINKKFTNYIPYDITFSVLSKLPIKSLKRFQCANKSWSLLLKDSNFMTMYSNNFLSNSPSFNTRTSILLNVSSDALYSLSDVRFVNKVKLNWPDLAIPNYRGGCRFDIVGFESVNGILCLHECFSRKIILWNPTTEEFKVIAPTPVEPFIPAIAQNFEAKVSFGVYVEIHGFGYDCVANDYKVICHTTLQPYFPDYPDLFNDDLPEGDELLLQDKSFTPFWVIYSLRSNSWRKLDFNMPNSYTELVSFSYGTLQVYLNGTCHWLCKYHERSHFVVECLVSFNLSNEMFFITHAPSDDTLEWTQLMVLNESIALISFPINIKTFYISILGEVGVKESWIKLLVVERPCVGIPIGAGMKGEMLFAKKRMMK